MAINALRDNLLPTLAGHVAAMAGITYRTLDASVAQIVHAELGHWSALTDYLNQFVVDVPAKTLERTKGNLIPRFQEIIASLLFVAARTRDELHPMICAHTPLRFAASTKTNTWTGTWQRVIEALDAFPSGVTTSAEIDRHCSQLWFHWLRLEADIAPVHVRTELGRHIVRVLWPVAASNAWAASVLGKILPHVVVLQALIGLVMGSDRDQTDTDGLMVPVAFWVLHAMELPADAPAVGRMLLLQAKHMATVAYSAHIGSLTGVLPYIERLRTQLMSVAASLETSRLVTDTMDPRAKPLGTGGQQLAGLCINGKSGQLELLWSSGDACYAGPADLQAIVSKGLDSVAYSRELHQSHAWITPLVVQEMVAPGLQDCPAIHTTFREADAILKALDIGLYPTASNILALEDDRPEGWPSTLATTTDPMRTYFELNQALAPRVTGDGNDGSHVFAFQDCPLRVAQRRIKIAADGKHEDMDSAPVYYDWARHGASLKAKFPSLARLSQLGTLIMYVGLLKQLLGEARARLFQAWHTGATYEGEACDCGFVESVQKLLPGIDSPPGCARDDTLVPGRLLANLTGFRRSPGSNVVWSFIGGIQFYAPRAFRIDTNIWPMAVPAPDPRPLASSAAQLRERLKLGEKQMLHVSGLLAHPLTSGTGNLSVSKSVSVGDFWIGLEKSLDGRKPATHVAIGYENTSIEANFDHIELVYTKPLERAALEIDAPAFDRFAVTCNTDFSSLVTIDKEKDRKTVPSLPFAVTCNTEFSSSVTISKETNLLFTKTVSVYVTDDAKVNLETRYSASDPAAKALALVFIARTIAKKGITSVSARLLAE